MIDQHHLINNYDHITCVYRCDFCIIFHCMMMMMIIIIIIIIIIIVMVIVMMVMVMVMMIDDR